MDASQLRRSSLFEGLADADVERCAGWFERTELTAGSRLVDEGEYSYRFFVVLDGDIEVRHDFQPVRRLGPGDYFGELGLLDHGRRTAKVLALTRGAVATIMSWDFRTMVAEYPVIASRIAAAAEQHRQDDAAAGNRPDETSQPER